MKDTTPFTDETPMPWGKHEGEFLGDVPLSYLGWLKAQDWIGKWKQLAAYLETRTDIDLVEDGGDNTEGYNSYDEFRQDFYGF